MLPSHTQALWLLCWIVIITAGEDIPCPTGGQIHLSSLRCYWLSEMTSSWSEAQDSCRQTQGGDLAAADSLDVQRFLHNSFPGKSTVWVWLKGSQGGGPQQVGVVPGGSEDQAVCTQMALRTIGQWRRTRCSGRYHFLCEKEVTESLPSMDSFLVGLVLMTGVYTRSQIDPLPTAPDIGQLPVEMQLFPGLWFSHAGQLAAVELVVQPSPVTSLARVQILRPYCNPNHHLVPPGCSSLLNPFSCCSVVPLCNTTGGCSLGQSWCHLLEACVPTVSPCSPYSSAAGGRGFALPPRYIAIPPFYHMVADFPLRINPESQLKTISVLLPEGAILVYPDDVVTIQHTRNPGAFLHCLNSEAALNSPWRQSYLSLKGTEWGGWWGGGLTSLPGGGQWVDGVVCDLRILYVDTLHRGTEHEDVSGSTHTGTTAAFDIRALTTVPTPSLRSEFGLNIIHPPLDGKNQIHVQINVQTLIVVKILSGERARCSWSAPVSQTGLPFHPSCPEPLAPSAPGCRRQSEDAWFSSVTVVLPSAGAQTLNISVTDAVSSQSFSVKMCGYEAVTGLSVEPQGRLRMLVDTPQSFTAKVEGGSSVTISWLIDNLETFTHEGESYSVVFDQPAEYKLKVTASNPVSSQTQLILLTADEMIPLAEPEFLSVRDVVAVHASHVFTLRVKVDVSLPITFRWDFGDGRSPVVHTLSAPCQTMEGLVERGEKQVYVQHSVNYTYSVSDDYTLHVQVSNQYDSIEESTKVSVRPRLTRLSFTSSTLMPLVNQTVLLEASTEPPADQVVYSWDFDDSSEPVHGSHRKVRHVFESAGLFNVTLCAVNSLSALTTWLMLEVKEEISGLSVSCNGPSELSSATELRAEVTTGTGLIWEFDFGDGSLQGNRTDGSTSHIYTSPGNYTVLVTVNNHVSQAHQSICVEVFRLAVSGLLPTECVMTGRNTEFTALVNGNTSTLAFHWLFGDGSPLTVLTGHSTITHTFANQGDVHVSLTVFSSVTSVSYSSSVCVEAPITDMAVRSSQSVVAVGQEVCFTVLVPPEGPAGYQFKWSGSSSGHAVTTQHAQQCFVFEEEGVEEVSVTARNKVSNKTAVAVVTIQKAVSDLSVMHDGVSDTVTVNTSVSFWVASCAGSDVSVLWDFGDESPAEPKQNVSHVFTSTGQFTVTATASNSVSRESVTLQVNVLLPVSDLYLHADRPYAAVGEETLITAVSSAISSSTYYWTVDGVTTAQQGTYQFRFAFPKPGVYQVTAVAQILVSKREAVVSIEVFERIEGLLVECQSLTNMTFVPTREELLFTASVIRGSDVSYHWLGTQSDMKTHITGDGEVFNFLVETPGRVSVQLRASNKLGETTRVVSAEGVERVTSAHITTRSNMVAVGRTVNMSVSVSTGSDLQYLWYVDLLTLRTHVPFLLHAFTSLGPRSVRVIVQNVLSQSEDTCLFVVQEEVEEVDFSIDGKKDPLHINTSAAVSFHGLINKGSDLHWDWVIRGGDTNLFNTTNQTFIYRFPHEGHHNVSLNVSNGLNWQAVSHSVTVQDAIEGLILNISRSSLCTEEQVTFTPTICKGSDVRFVLTFQKEHRIHSEVAVEGEFTTSGLPAGTHLVTLKALNQVSTAEVSSRVLVVESIKGLRLVNDCPPAVEALKGVHFKVEVDVQSRLPVNYTWMFHLVGSEPKRLTGQDVIFTPTASGSLSVGVRASNGVCSKTLNRTTAVEWPVQKVKLVCLSERIFVGHVVTFSAINNRGSNLRYLWDLGDSEEASVTDSSAVNHTYHIAGEYRVEVKVSNSVSNISAQLQVEVEELQCSSPEVSLNQRQTTIVRSRPSFFEASVNINCSSYKAVHQWEMFREPDCTQDFTANRVVLGDAASPLLFLPKRSLSVGRYCLKFTVSLQGTPLLVQQETKVTVVHSPLEAVIKGGSRRVWASLSDLVLDGTGSQDPDVEPGEEDALQYHWTYTTYLQNFTTTCSEQPAESHTSIMTVLSNQLQPDTVYVFTLTVHKTGRKSASVTQTVTVCEGPVLPVFVACVSCSASPPHISYSAPIVLSGQCEQCDHRAQYNWSAEDQTGMTFDLDEVTTSTGRHSSDLVVRSGVLQPGQTYTFTLNVTEPGRGRWGGASMTVQPNNPPHGGLCEISPVSDIRLLETVVTFQCTGWKDDDSEASQLIYSFLVAPCTITTVCPVLTLYRGTRSTFGSVVPAGRPGQGGNTSVITVSVLVEDNLGSKVIALNRTLTVESHVSESVASQWLRNKSRTELQALVQHGNPQEIITYCIALTSRLNQMESGQSITELTSRREIRENVTKALASLPMSSLQDVHQISSALALSTAVPGELGCDGCQEKVLGAVEKMIHVMEEQMSPGILSGSDTGRNILHVIGSSLAALSESVDASSPHWNSSSTLQSASAVALSALGHAGALMRSLMHSRVHGEEPVMLFTPYISAVGFHGNPSDLLCTQQSNQVIPSQSASTDGLKNSLRCPFHIPASLAANLRNQSSEVVQVLFGIDGALESHPLLTAANPPISTSLVAMELTTPQGEPIPIHDLDSEQAIQVTLPNKYPVGQGDGGGERMVDEHANGTFLRVELPTEGQLNFTIQSLAGLHERAGLYISFHLSLAPGATPVSSGHVKMDVSSAVLGTNESQTSRVKEWAVTLSARTSVTEETIFLSPLLNGTDWPLSITLTSSVGDGGPVLVSTCVFSSLCQYYSVKERRWSSDGLRPLEGSTLHTARCLTQHLTMFGASLFVHPGALVLLPPSGGPMRNVVVGIVCAVLLLIHLLVGLIAHKLDHLDSLRLSQVPLCGRPGLFHYRVLVKTGRRRGAGTSAHVGISLHGVNKSGSRHLKRDGAFQRGSLDQFHLETDDSLGEVWKIRIWHDNTGLDPSWYVQHVVVFDPQTDHMFFFLVDDWLSVENQKTGTVEKEVLASCPEELSQFPRVLNTQLMFGMVERHLWLSLWERPAHSRFTRGQRVTCSAVTLHLYLALGALWYGAVGSEQHSGPVSGRMLVNMETVAVGMTVAVLLFPLQSFLCFLFRKAHSQVIVDMSVPPSPVCHSVEMDIHLGQSQLSGPSFLSLPDSSSPDRDSPSSLLESKAFDSSILDFWAVSGLVPQTDGSYQEEEGVAAWASCDSLLSAPAASSTRTSPAPDFCKASLGLCPTRQLRRKKALMQLRLAPPPTSSSPHLLLPIYINPLSEDISNPSLPTKGQDILTMNTNQHKVHNLTTFLTLSEEDLLMSIEASAEGTNSSSDSGRDSPRTASSFSNTQSTSCSSWSDESEGKSLRGADLHRSDPQSSPSPYETKLCRRHSVLSVDSVASTFLPSPSPDSTRSSSTTRIGVARGQPGWLLPHWALSVIYPLVAVLLGTCLALVGLYGSFFSRGVLLMWLISALSAFLTSALLLEPLKVCLQALFYAALWRPVDPEVEDQLARETSVVRPFGDRGGKVRPPCGYGLLQAKEEARKVRALRTLMRHSVGQLLFLLLVLMLNYQDSVEQKQGRLLHSAVRQRLHTAPLGGPNLTSLRDWSEAEQWMNLTLVAQLHRNPLLHLVGLPRLRHTHTLGPVAGVFLGNSSEMTHRLLAELHMGGWSTKEFTTLSVDYTQHHRESALFVCVSIQLEWVQVRRVALSLSIRPLFIPSSFPGLDLHTVLTVLLLTCALLLLIGELRFMAAEPVLYLHPGRHWLQLLLVSLSMATSILQLCFLSQATSCVSKLRSQPDNFINFHGPAILAQRSSQCAAVLLTLLILKLLGTLRFVRRWVLIGRVLQRAWRELWAVTVLLLLLLLLCTHLGKTLFSCSVEGFLSVRQAGGSVLSILRGRFALQRLCRVHPLLGPVYGLLLMGGGVWLLARLCGAILIRSYRAEKADLYRRAVEPQDYEMVEFFIKRLKLWMGITKAKEFRHNVKFEGVDTPSSRSSQESRLSTLSSFLPSSHSPSLSSSSSPQRPLSSSLSVRSEGSAVSEHAFDVQPFLDHLLPCVNALLSGFDRVNQITKDMHNLEVELEEALTRRRTNRISNHQDCAEQRSDSAEPKEPEGEGRTTGEVRHRRKGLLYPKPQVYLSSSFSFPPPAASLSLLPRTHSSYSESQSVQLLQNPSTDPPSASGSCGLHPAASPGSGRLPQRRAWHSGSSHSADAAQRMFQKQCGGGGESFPFTNSRPRSEEGVRRRISDGVPRKRKAWISEGPETE